MNGVVLWSCRRSWRAIVWCEDHAALAYVRGEESFVSGSGFPGEGDLIAFELNTVDRVRYARAVRLVERDAFPDLVRSLTAAAAAQNEAPAVAPVPVPVAAPARAPVAAVGPARVPRLVAVCDAPERRAAPAAPAASRRAPLRLAAVG